MGEEKKIVVEHVRVEELPAKLREGLENGKLVRVTVEEEQATTPPPQRTLRSFVGTARQFKKPEDAEAYIRKLRDEWDD
jgi:hypothetical protein